MDNLRFPLIAAFLVTSFLLYQAWQEDYAAKPVADYAASDLENPASADELSVPTAASSSSNETPSAEVPTAAVAESPAASTPAVETTASGKSIRVETDLVIAEVSTTGGTLQRMLLKQYSKDTTEPDGPRYQLLNNRLPYYFVAQTGLVSATGNAPNHLETFVAEKQNYVLAEGENTLEVALHWQGENGIHVKRVLSFTRGSYEVVVRDEVSNQGNAAWTGAHYSQLQRSAGAEGSSAPFVQTYNGAAIYQKEQEDSYKYRKYDFEDLDEANIEQRFNGGWVAMVQHYFFGATLPADDSANNRYYLKSANNGRYLAGFVGPNQNVAPGENRSYSSRFFLGPKLQEELETVAPGLTYTVDYGILTVLSKPMFWLMGKMYGLVSNWGVVIILITLLIKLGFYKLSEAQYRSMAKMRKFGPRIKTLRERYADDRQKMNQAMMDLYKKEKFNPLGGCLPMLVQIPVFIALYWVLLESVELRGAPFALWIQDLSTQDPYFVLPLLLGAAMFFQQRLSNQSMAMDPMQAKIMQFMPVMFCVFFAFFPAGLVLYWLMNTVLGMAQQLYITNKVDAEDKAKAKA